MEENCNICHTIWLGFTSAESRNEITLGPVDEITLGPFDEILSSSCSIHKPLIKWYKSTSKYHHRCSVVFKPRSKSSSAYIYALYGRPRDLLLVNRTSIPNHPGLGRILDPCWVDIDLLPRWKHECLAAHGAKCENPLKIWPTRPDWLIDVERNCIVSGEEVDGAFIALSYRFGDHPSGEKINADTWFKLQEPNALKTARMSLYLSPMIRDAMYVTSAIGERYLWADSLCIPHHDRGAATRQLQFMGAIYGNAIVTIIAGDTDSQEGLPGLRGISGPRRLTQIVIPFGEEYLVARDASLSIHVYDLPYSNRGWTYQEYEYSGRKLYFYNKKLRWHCSCSVWHEDMIFGAEADVFTATSMDIIRDGFPETSFMSGAISNYNKRKLRYDDDALPAISGLLSIASRSFPGGFLYGLPEMFFDAALGWRRDDFGKISGEIGLRRRKPSKGPTDIQLHPSGLPSWSWIGWQGEIEMCSDEAVRINPGWLRIQKTFPITEWYTPDTATSERRRIGSTWFSDRDSYRDSNTPLPTGWTRHEKSTKVDEEVLAYFNHDGPIFKHEALPEEEWYSPFPVPAISESTQPFTPEQTTHLFCETQRAFLRAHIRVGSYRYEEPTVELLDAENGKVGVLYYHNDLQLEDLPPGTRVELVAICEYKACEKTWDDESSKFGHPIIKGEYIGVLWVEWMNGVAYRRASGKVEKEAWNKLALERISLILG